MADVDGDEIGGRDYEYAVPVCMQSLNVEV
jgi:hypothetical protein